MKRYLVGLVMALAVAVAGANGAYAYSDHARPDHIGARRTVQQSVCAEDAIAISATMRLHANAYACLHLDDIASSYLGGQASMMVRYCGAHNAYVYAPINARYTMRCVNA